MIIFSSHRTFIIHLKEYAKIKKCTCSFKIHSAHLPKCKIIFDPIQKIFFC